MTEYAGKQELIDAIKDTSAQYIREFDDIGDADKDFRVENADRTPYENLAYQLGWMECLRQWERLEQAGETPEMPASGVKWNSLGPLHQQFYTAYRSYSMQELKILFTQMITELCSWIDTFEEAALFQPGGRKWAQSTPANWPVWKWVHINTVAPFKSFRSKIRKWKRLRPAQH